MFEKRNRRWLAVVVVAIVSVAFAGVSVILPFSNAFQSQQPGATPSPSPTGSPSPQGDLAAQAKGYELVLQREPDNQTALRGLVDIKIRQGDIKGIVAPLEKLAALNPDQPDYTVLLAQAKQRTGDREGAAQAYRNVLATHPGDLNALKGLTDLLLQQERPEAAIGLLQDTIKTADEANKTKPGTVDVASVQLLLGEVYAVQKRYDEALTIYDRAIASNTQDFRPLLGKAIVLRTQGKTEEAKPLFASAAALAPAQYKDQINQLASSPSPRPAAPTVSPSPEANTSPSPSPSPSPAASPSAESSPAAQ